MAETIVYEPQGTCSKLIRVEIEDDNTIKDVNFRGGCPGNLLGIRSLVKGKNIDEIISLLEGIPCGSKSTSCPDQLSIALRLYAEAKSGAAVQLEELIYA